MSYILLFLLFGSTAIVFAETSSELDRIKEHLENSAEQLTITQFSKAPKAASYLNSHLTKNSPHEINLAKELTEIIPEWSPRVLALDPTCPYYFSKFNNSSLPEDDLNLLSYLQAIDSNKTVAYPFVNVLPQSYLSALPLLSIFQCRELISSTSTPFFHNIELILGPGKTELPLKRQSDQFSQFYCSLYGSPHFLLINQTKQPTITYDTQTLLSQDNLDEINFFLTSLPSGTCLFVPPDWVTGVQLNNSILIVFTMKKLEKMDLSCTKTGKLTLEMIEFAIKDTFNISTIALLGYFYQYLNPPLFDQEYNSQTFYETFREDKNVSQLIIKWTPELIDIIQNKLFHQLDINHDEQFSPDDYFDIKQSNVDQLQEIIYEILEEIRQTVLGQYNELSDNIKKIIKQSGTSGFDEKTKKTLETMIENLPEPVKERLETNNVKVKELLNQIKSKKKKQHVKEDKPSKSTINQNRTDL